MEPEPRYNIRAVARMTGVPAPTLRSWERRYGFPAPARTPTARRLYSEEDVRAVRWVRAQTERGLAAAQAIEWVIAGGAGTPALVEVGELWARGEIDVAAEHFYSNLVRRRLLALLAGQPAIAPQFTAALACLPGEQHELGLMMLALFLRWSGARVIYLGADQPVRDLIRLAQGRTIDAICLSAGREASWEALDDLTTGLAAVPNQPRIYLGGAAAQARAAPAAVRVLTGSLADAAAIIVSGGNGGAAAMPSQA
jgi:DNA-binding transcriptional MerR regulator